MGLPQFFKEGKLKMKKIVSIALALIMVLSSVSALAEGFTLADSYDVGERTFNAGSVTLAEAPVGGGTVTSDVYAGEEGKDYTDEKVYTFNDYTSALTSSMNWDVLSWETNEDSAITDYIITGFYGFHMNSDKSGYSITPEAAAEMPVDVTAEYVGQYGIEEGETAKAWRIALNPDLCFDDGTKINADDYVYSMQQQLNPKILNRRADSWYDGTFSIVNAKNYLYGGKTTYDAIPEAAEDLLAAGTEVYLDMDFWGITGALDAEGNAAPQYVSVADETLYRDAAVAEGEAEDWVSAKYLYDNYLAAGAPYASYAPDYLKVANTAKMVTWDEVGLKKIDDYTIDFILEAPVAEPAFYVPYNLSGSFLVKKDLYEACKTFYKDGAEVATEEEADEVKSDYCRSLEKTVSYGPYMLTSFQLDKEYTLSRNENWFGYHDGKHLGQYQTDNIVVSVIADHATALLAFEKGEVDGVSLQNEDMDKYASSAYIHYTPQSYTTKLTWNTDYSKLVEHGTNSQIMVVDEFRKAFAFALDANDFATAYTAAGTAGYGMLNYMYCYNPFTGEAYRDSEPAKKALVELFDMEYGEGKDYATLDEAYEAMTGYDMAKAQELMAIAADKAIAANIWDGESPIVLDIRLYNSDTIYVQMYNYFKTQLTEAVKGSKFEGKIDMTMTPDADYYNTNYSGGADMIFTTWGGAAMDPFGVFARCYCDASDGSGNQMEYGYDTSKIMVTYDFGGEIGEITDTLQHWAMWANNATTDVPVINEKLGAFANYAYSTRCEVVAGVEHAFLNWFPTTSLYYRNVASLASQKVNWGSDTYLNIIGFGGIEFYTYNYDDAAWADYIANNTLVY
jgi:ABC-type transport system substrate-binding protein